MIQHFDECTAMTRLRYLRRPRVDDPEAFVLAGGGIRVAVVVPHDVLDQLVVRGQRVDVHACLDVPQLHGHVRAHTVGDTCDACHERWQRLGHPQKKTGEGGYVIRTGREAGYHSSSLV